ncbi:MAG: AAA family ATPase [Oscillospiraceae bacterium]|nr:AAA family ATPase [Oscillospiraceae bacterium]
MRIYRMTATFGKLEHATLELEPGLNIITAPNEWGKSTWCAFLVAMLYGFDTRSKSTKTALADKTHYQPWSGAPMEGRIDLNWNGRDITIERRTHRRVPLGEFKAYETESGLPVTELTAANCGQMLLGVEQTVFRRAGFIRHADLPLTQDEALRRRLNALVTTGDDSGAAERLAEDLKTLRNRCRYNRTGLLPQAEARREELEGKIGELDTLEEQMKKLRRNLEDIKLWLKQLYNHQQSLAYREMEQIIARVAQAKTAREEAEQELARLEAVCAQLPSRDAVDSKVRELRSFLEMRSGLEREYREAPREPIIPQMPEPFSGMTAEAAWEMARADAKTYTEITKTKAPGILLLVGVLGLLAAAGLWYLQATIYAGGAAACGLLAFVWGLWEKIRIKKQVKGLLAKYGDPNWKHWVAPIGKFEKEQAAYRTALKEYREIQSDLEVRMMVLRKKRESLGTDQDPDEAMEQWQAALENWNACLQARQQAAQTKRHHEALNAMVKPVEKPTMEDHLTQSEQETTQLLADCAEEQQRLQNRLGQYQGRMEILGDREELSRQLEQVRERIRKLEETYAALVLAQDTLAAAKAELQRRYAPRITKRAQQLLSDMTGGRYRRLTMQEDFSLQAGTEAEDTLRDALWRSDGTMDQLYLALRLAVAEELTPKAPLVLDDVLVRFDDTRMQAAVNLLRKMSADKQIICFTCQTREAECQ